MSTKEVTIGLRDFKAKLSQVVAELDGDTAVLITRHGRPCARLTSVGTSHRPKKASLSTLRDRLPPLPDATYEDFQKLKAIWHLEMPTDSRQNSD